MRKSGDRRPYVKPVTKLELSQDHVKLRWILIGILLTIAAVAIGYGFHQALSVQPGWNVVNVHSQKTNSSAEIRLMYDFSDYGGSANVVNQQLETIYTQTCEDGYAIFSPHLESSFHNVRSVNENPNQVLEVPAALYEAFALLAEYDDRSIFLAPVYIEYARVFRSESDAVARQYDPAFDAETLEYVKLLTGFAADPEMIHLELLGENRVKLYISPEYLAFAREQGITDFLDFGWLRNAFIIDYMAETLSENGFTAGYLTSRDGFTRNLDGRGQEFTVSLFHKKGNDVYLPAVFNYQGPLSIVQLRSYPLSGDSEAYYLYEDGTAVSLFLAPDGICRTAVDCLTGYSPSSGCARLALELSPVYLQDALEAQPLRELSRQGIHTIWCMDRTVYYTEEMAAILPNEVYADDPYALEHMR